MRNQIYFRLPFSKTIFSNDVSSENHVVQFTSFDGLEKLDFKGNLQNSSVNELLINPLFSKDLNFKLNKCEEESEENYTKKLDEVISFIQKNKIPKLVISRRKILDLKDKNINLSQSFLNLIKAYDNAFTYLFRTENACWLGAFSEVLGKFNKENATFETMSLAGTLALNKTWTSKELDEQKTVSNYVKSVLSKYSDEVEISETKDHISGNIKHLRTDFKLKLERKNLENLISELHPTPAVCGIPKEFCKTAISNFEENPREFYAGYSKVETTDEIYYFVNLRCSKIHKNAAEVFVGGGITAQSKALNEWAETELKAEAILKNLEFF
ncbi:isochorismate synthase [Halpernia humi]|uniref:Isochorismate synthase n=1 Tax=Halpernia humi TaxID=493375 RepID=A0A1H5UEQ1_9FLAO|nr:chorismate-binding protein [Halpernia humi]SEF72851.1 isochorismate synthase [Halpernia humi]